MDIKYLGHASFQIKTKKARIVTDPFSRASTGLPFPKTEADIITVSHAHEDHNAVSEVSGNPLIIDWAGEYEKSEVRIFGFQTYHDKKEGAERGENILFKFDAENLTVLHCGDLGHILSDETIENVGEVDVLLIPVGGFYTINPEEAAENIKKIEPQIVIPMHYNRKGLNPAVFSSLEPLETFLKVMGAEGIVPEPKLQLSRESFDQEMRIVVLQS